MENNTTLEAITGISQNFSFDSILGWIGIITTSVIVLAVSIKSVVDVLKTTGIFHPSWMDTIYRNEDEKIKKTLQELGVLEKVDHYKSLTKSLNINTSITNSDESKEILTLLAKKYTERANLIVGDTTQQEIKYYLNLRKAFLNGDAERIVQMMCSLIVNKSREQSIVYDCIISRKNALDLLGYEVAKRLQVPFILYHEQKSILNMKDHSVEPFDYLPDDIQYPIIVDDSNMGGTSMVDLAIRYHQETDINIQHAFILFTRNINSVDKLKAANVTLHFLAAYCDEDLKELTNE